MSSFFFSSRRRHTRFDCDWSSDVCSSDLDGVRDEERPVPPAERAYLLHRLMGAGGGLRMVQGDRFDGTRSEEHTSELQSQSNLVCRLLLEKKKKNNNKKHH